MRHVEIELDKTRRLKYGFNAIADIEDRAGFGLDALLSDAKIGFSTIRLLMWGGLKWEDRGLTVERAGKLIEIYLESGNSLKTLMDDYIQPALDKLKYLGNAETEAGE